MFQFCRYRRAWERAHRRCGLRFSLRRWPNTIDSGWPMGSAETGSRLSLTGHADAGVSSSLFDLSAPPTRTSTYICYKRPGLAPRTPGSTAGRQVGRPRSPAPRRRTRRVRGCGVVDHYLLMAFDHVKVNSACRYRTLPPFPKEGAPPKRSVGYCDKNAVTWHIKCVFLPSQPSSSSSGNWHAGEQQPRPQALRSVSLLANA
jgi:hypothetical protein